MAVEVACVCVLPSPPLRAMLTGVFRLGACFIVGVVAFWCLIFDTLFVGAYLGFNGLYLV